MLDGRLNLSSRRAMQLRSILCVLGAGAVAACGGSEPKPTPVTPIVPVVTTVTVVQGVTQVEVGATATFTAEVRDQNGALMAGKTPTWTSSDPAIASIDATSGLLRGIAPGSVILTASVMERAARRRPT